MAGGTPKKRKPRGRTNQRRSHHALAVPPVTACPQCHTPILLHTACPVCGTYRGRQVQDVSAREKKRARKERERKQTATAEGRA